MIQSLAFFHKQKSRLDRYEQIILEYTKTKEDEVLMKQKRDNTTLTNQGKSQVPISQLNIKHVTCILLIYSHFE